jgi:hypothetical protein
VHRQDPRYRRHARRGRAQRFLYRGTHPGGDRSLWIKQTLERFPDLELDGEPTRVRALFLNQYNSIPVRRTS